MSFLFRSVSRLFVRPASSSSPQLDDADDLPPRLRAIVTTRYAPLPEYLDLAPGSPPAHDPVSTTGSESPFSPFSPFSPSSLPENPSEDLIAVLDLSSPTTPPGNPINVEHTEHSSSLPEHSNTSYLISHSYDQSNDILSVENISNGQFSLTSRAALDRRATFEGHKSTTNESKIIGDESYESIRDLSNTFHNQVESGYDNEGITDALSDESDEFLDSLGDVYPNNELEMESQPTHDSVTNEKSHATFIIDSDKTKTSPTYHPEKTLITTSHNGESEPENVALLQTIDRISSTISKYSEEETPLKQKMFPSASECEHGTHFGNNLQRSIVQLLSERVTAVNALILEHKAPQVVLYASGESALMWLHTPPPPPVTLFTVDDEEAHHELTPGVVPFLPNNVHVKQVRTELENQTWDSDLVEQGFDWHLPSVWVVHIDLALKQISSFSAFDIFLRNVHRLTNAQSTIIVAYPIPSSHPANDAYAVSFSSSDFAVFVRRRSFRVLSDKHLEVSFKQKMRIAALAHGSSEFSAKTSQLTSLESAYSSSEYDSDSENEGSADRRTTSSTNIGNTSDEDSTSDVRAEHTNFKGRPDNSVESSAGLNGKEGREGVPVTDTDIANESPTDNNKMDTESGNSCEEEQEIDPTLRNIQFRLAVGSMPEESIHWSVAAVVIGSDPVLGCWDPQRARKMEGNIFDRGTTLQAGVDVKEDAGRFEYKYALINAENWIVAWEAGANRVIECINQLTTGEEHVYNDAWRY